MSYLLLIHVHVPAAWIMMDYMCYFQTDIDDLKRQNGILDQQGMALVFGEVMYLMVRNILHDVNLCLPLFVLQ